MATRNSNRGDEEPQLRFIMLEARGKDALQQITQALANAVRPPLLQSMIASPALPALPQNGQEHHLQPVSDFHPTFELDTEGTVKPSTPRKKGTTAKRPYRPLKVLDLDLISGKMPFSRYHQEKNPGDHTKRYLVIATWLKEYLNTNEINDDHIYTCYRALNINPLNDVGSVFRSCKRQGWVNSGSKPGYYAINHIGLGQVNNIAKGKK